MSIRNILVPTDFSQDAACALESAIELARPLSAKVHLLHAYFIALPIAIQPAFGPDVFELLRSSAQSALEPLEKRLAELGLAYQSHLQCEAPLAAILETARSLPADLIVMGTRGRSGLQHVLLGSIAERTVRLAPCPVITVKAPRPESPAMSGPKPG